MNKLSFLVIVLIILVTRSIVAQSPTDSIEIRRGFKMAFIQHDVKFTRVEAVEIMKANPEAEKKMQLSIINSNIGTISRFVGGVLVFLPIAKKIEGKIPNWTPAKIGVGLIIVSFPFVGFSASYAEKAVDIFNSGINHLCRYHSKYQFEITSEGIGLKIRL